MTIQDGRWHADTAPREKLKKSVSNQGEEDLGSSCTDSAVAPVISRVPPALQPSVTS